MCSHKPVWIMGGNASLSLIYLFEGSSSPVCDADQFKCADFSQCLDVAYRCDGQPDCLDASDEKHCNGEILVVDCRIY